MATQNGKVSTGRCIKARSGVAIICMAKVASRDVARHSRLWRRGGSTVVTARAVSAGEKLQRPDAISTAGSPQTSASSMPEAEPARVHMAAFRLLTARAIRIIMPATHESDRNTCDTPLSKPISRVIGVRSEAAAMSSDM